MKANATEHMAVLVTTGKDAERLTVPVHVLVQEVHVTKGAGRLPALGAVPPMNVP